MIKVALAVCVFSENWYRWGAEWHCVTLSCEQKWVAVLAWPCPKSTGAWVVGMYYRLTLHLTAWVWRGLGGRQDQKPLHLPSWGRGHAALLRGEPAWRPPRINMLRNSGHSRKGSSPVSTSAWECVFVVFFFSCIQMSLSHACWVNTSLEAVNILVTKPAAINFLSPFLSPPLFVKSSPCAQAGLLRIRAVSGTGLCLANVCHPWVYRSPLEAGLLKAHLSQVWARQILYFPTEQHQCMPWILLIHILK